MFLLVLIACLATELYQYAAEGPLTIDDVSTTHPEQQKKIIDEHNKCRRMVDPPSSNMVKMVWSQKLAENAQKWAKLCTLKHSPPKSREIEGKPCGENLFMASILYPWSYAIMAWFNEIKDFKYGTGAVPKGAMVGHFTQMVWDRTYEMGCAVAYCPDQPMFKYYHVCQYSPAGNIVGRLEKPYKEGTPCGDCPNHCDNKLCTNPCEHWNKYSNCDNMTRTYGCDHSMLKEPCKESCDCEGKIR